MNQGEKQAPQEWPRAEVPTPRSSYSLPTGSSTAQSSDLPSPWPTLPPFRISASPTVSVTDVHWRHPNLHLHPRPHRWTSKRCGGLTCAPNLRCPGMNPSPAPALWPAASPAHGNSRFAVAPVTTPGVSLTYVPHMPHQQILLVGLPSNYVNVRPFLPCQEHPP